MSKVIGLEEFGRNMERLSNRVKDLEGQQSVPISELLTPQFMAECSRFNSADELFRASGFKIENKEDFEAVPDAEWDAFIQGNTTYSGWESMLAEAGKAWMIKRLGF